jgi:predicted RNA-binding protein with TRAM domain
MTRQNVTDGPREILTTRCLICDGDGIVVSDETYAVEAERQLRRLAASSKSESFLVELPSAVAALVIGPAGSRLAEIERDTGRMFAFETRDDLAADHFQVIAEGPAAQVVPSALPVAVGQEIELELLESHKHHPDDAIGRLDGYVIAVAGAAERVGETVTARIERATRTVAYAVLAGEAPDVEAPVDAGSMVEQDEAEAAPSGAPRKKSARGGARGGARRKAAVAEATEQQTELAGPGGEADGEHEPDAQTTPKKRTRRGTRGGRGRKKTTAVEGVEGEGAAGSEAEAGTAVEAPDGTTPELDEPPGEEGAPLATAPVEVPETAPKKRTRRGSRGGRGRKKAASASDGPEATSREGGATADDGNGSTAAPASLSENGAAQPKKRTRRGSRGGQGRKKAATETASGSSANESDVGSAPEQSTELAPADGVRRDGDGEAADAERASTRRGSRGGRGRRKAAGKPVVADADAG